MTVNTYPVGTIRSGAVPQSSPLSRAPPNTPTTPTTDTIGNAATTPAPLSSGRGITAPANTPVTPAQPAIPSPSRSRPSDLSHSVAPDQEADDEDHAEFGDESDDDEERNHNGKALPAHIHLLPPASPHPTADLLSFFTFKGFVTLVVTPFFQGMFYGFGEGAAKVLLGRYYGVDPLIALGGGPPKPDRRRRRRLSLAGWFNRDPVAPAIAAVTAPGSARWAATSPHEQEWIGVGRRVYRGVGDLGLGWIVNGFSVGESVSASKGMFGVAHI